MRIPYEEMKSEFERVLLKHGFDEISAKDGAEIFADNSLAGVYSHGLNRFPRLIEYIEKGYIDPKTKATKLMGFGAMERWDGHRGFGPLNAKMAMDRACELANEYGMGIVALGNNNHWMRGATYGYEAAKKGLIGICWSNTTPNMPAWGAKDARIGNNPLIMAVPRSNGMHVVVDCAMSQFSFGKIESTRLAGKQLPLPGGYNKEGEFTCDPEEIEESGRVLPMGYWKGSGFSIVLDLIATVLSNGNSVPDIAKLGDEVGLTQIMIAIDPSKGNTAEETDRIVENILEDMKKSTPDKEGGQVLYPGERSATDMIKNRTEGIPVVEEIWNRVKNM